MSSEDLSRHSSEGAKAEDTHLVCYRVSEVTPSLQSFVDRCDSCGHAVWHAYSSPSTDRVLCMQCAKIAMAAHDGEIEIKPPTADQLADWKKAFE